MKAKYFRMYTFWSNHSLYLSFVLEFFHLQQYFPFFPIWLVLSIKDLLVWTTWAQICAVLAIQIPPQVRWATLATGGGKPAVTTFYRTQARSPWRSKSISLRWPDWRSKDLAVKPRESTHGSNMNQPDSTIVHSWPIALIWPSFPMFLYTVR